MNKKNTTKSIEVNITPNLNVFCNVQNVEIKNIDGLKKYAAANSKDSKFASFLISPLLAKKEDGTYELMHSPLLWAKELKNMTLTHIRAYVISDDINEQTMQSIRAYCFFIGSNHSTCSTNTLIDSIISRIDLNKTILTGFYPDKKTLQTNMIMEIIGESIASESTINRRKQACGITKSNVSTSQSKHNDNPKMRWDSYAIPKNYYPYKSLIKRLHEKNPRAPGKFIEKLTNEETNLNQLHVDIESYLSKGI